MFNFTTLGATGRAGPDGNAGYSEHHIVELDDGKQKWNVPLVGKYYLEACGASGGDGFKGFKGGRGVKISGVVHLRKGDKLEIIVGQKGSSPGDSHPGSGGGGTFVVYTLPKAYLLVAGGGGGAGPKDGLSGNFHKNGSGIAAGSCGHGGFVCGGKRNFPTSGSGAGIIDDGGCYVSQAGKEEACVQKSCDQGGRSFSSGGEGGKGISKDCDGGFGGGGACENLPGGGGGYSGGGVEPNIAGGGGSFKSDTLRNVRMGDCAEGDGYVTFLGERRVIVP